IWNAARKIAIEAKLEVLLRVEGAIRLGQKPAAPVGLSFADLLHLRATTPARSVIVPNNLDFANLTEFAADNVLPGCGLVGLATMLGPDLHDELTRSDGVPSSLGLLQDVRHWFFAVGVLTGFGGHREMGCVLEIGSGDDYGIDVLELKHVFDVLEQA